jgi:imidazolonepropionase-like amidohydrolase
VLDGHRVVHHHTHRADDILTVLRIQQEFGHRVVLQHASEAWLVADEIARSGIPVSTLVVDAPGGKHEAVNLRLETPGILERAGVKVALHTDDFITSSRLLLRMAALAVQGGMSEAGALRAVTLHAAEMLDLGARLGSLEPGKDADLVVLSGPPFSVRTRVLETWIEGERVFDAADPADRLYQSGGFGVAERYP